MECVSPTFWGSKAPWLLLGDEFWWLPTKASVLSGGNLQGCNRCSFERLESGRANTTRLLKIWGQLGPSNYVGLSPSSPFQPLNCNWQIPSMFCIIFSNPNHPTWTLPSGRDAPKVPDDLLEEAVSIDMYLTEKNPGMISKNGCIYIHNKHIQWILVDVNLEDAFWWSRLVKYTKETIYQWLMFWKIVRFYQWLFVSILLVPVQWRVEFDHLVGISSRCLIRGWCHFGLLVGCCLTMSWCFCYKSDSHSAQFWESG